MHKFLIIFISFYVVGCASSKNVQTLEQLGEKKQSDTQVVVETKQNIIDQKIVQLQIRQQLDEMVKKALTDDSLREYLASDLFIKANDASMRGESMTASILFEYVNILNPNDDYIKRKLAVEYIRNGELKKSKPLLENLFKKTKKHDDGIGLILGGVYTALDDVKASKSVYRKILAQDPKNEEACVFLAKVYATEKKFKTAYGLLDKCEKKVKNNGIFSYFKGKIALERGHRKSAKKYFRDSLKRQKSYYQSAIALGLVFEEKQKYDAAIKVYKRFLKSNPDSFSVLSRLVQILFAKGEYKKVLPYAERLARLDSSDLNLKVRLGILYTDAGKYDEAIGIFKEILIAVPDSDKILYYLGSLYQQVNNYEQSISYFNKINSESSLFLDSNLQMAQMLNVLALKAKETGDQNKVKEFISFTENAMKNSPDIQVELGVILASFYETIDDVDGAIKALKDLRGVKGFTDQHDYYLASLFEKAQDFQASIEIVEELLVKNPDDANALNFLGYSLLERGEEMDKAFRYIRKAADLKPDDGYILDSLGWYYYKIGQYKKALTELKKAWELVKDDVEINKHLAMVYKKLKSYDKAKKYYVEALKFCKIDSEKKEVLDALEDLEKKRLPASGN